MTAGGQQKLCQTVCVGKLLPFPYDVMCKSLEPPLISLHFLPGARSSCNE